VVDAKHGHLTLDEQPEAQNQVGFADRILLSKTISLIATKLNRCARAWCG